MSGQYKPILNTRDQDKPFEFTVGIGEVIKGWDEGMVGMRLGEVRSLLIPASEAYGDEPFEPWGVPPRTTLNLRVELTTFRDAGLSGSLSAAGRGLAVSGGLAAAAAAGRGTGFAAGRMPPAARAAGAAAAGEPAVDAEPALKRPRVQVQEPLPASFAAAAGGGEPPPAPVAGAPVAELAD
eukprot:Hpha_TRINITY_DN8566_c0_g1::TRINITY_DN8566_c0_g1_i3::g.146639::m.146639